MIKRVLFVCGKGRHRSPTAEQVFSGWLGIETDSAGIGEDSDVPLSVEQLEWANLVAVMEKRQISRIKRKFGPLPKGLKVVSLDIPDDYRFMQTELVDLLKSRSGRLA